MIVRKTLVSVIVITLLTLFAAATCYCAKSDSKSGKYIHHEFVYGTARVDYVEVINEKELVTHYYNYDDPADQFRVTSVEVYNGSKYYPAASPSI